VAGSFMDYLSGVTVSQSIAKTCHYFKPSALNK